MAVYKMTSGVYRIQFCLNGRNYVKSSKTTSKKVAQQMEDKWRTDIHNKLYLGSKDEITIQTLIDDYLLRPLAQTTRTNASLFFKQISKDINFNINASDFNQNELLKFIQKRLSDGVSQASIRTQMLYLASAWNGGNRKAYNIPPLELPTLKKSPMKTEYLSEADEEQLFTFLRERPLHASGAGAGKDEVYDIFVMLLDTGCRHNEVCRLEWNNIDLKNKTIELFRKKTGTQSFIRMTNRVHSVLQRRSEDKKHNQWVFPNNDRTSHRQDHTAYLNTLLKKAGLKYSVHQMRHTFASKLLKAGMTLPEIQLLLGHQNIASTCRYSHLEKNVTSAKAVDVLNKQQVENNRSQLKVV